jgi:hypothetical protein
LQQLNFEMCMCFPYSSVSIIGPVGIEGIGSNLQKRRHSNKKN